MRLARVWPLVVCLALVVGVPRGARADLSPPKDVEAKRMLLEGNTFYRLRNFEKAIAKYRLGVKIEDAPVFYYNIAQCFRQWNKYKDALWYYRRYIGRGNVRPEVAKAVRRFIKSMQRELKKSASTQPPVEMAGGKKSGSGEATKLIPKTSATEGDDDESQARPGSAPRWYNDWLGWSVTGLGIAAGITGVLLFDSASTLDGKADIEPDQILREQYRGQSDSRRSWGLAFSLASGAAILAGVVKLALTPGKSVESNNKLTVGITRRGIMLSGRF